MTCYHTYFGQKPTGMCADCLPSMFPTAEQMDAGRRWMADWNEYAGNVFKHEVPPPVGVPVTDAAVVEAAPAPAAASPDEDEVAIALVRKLLRQRADELGMSVADMAAAYLPVLQERVRAARRYA